MNNTRKFDSVAGGSVAVLGPGSMRPSMRIQNARHTTSIFLGSTGQ
jgi:hypothetical protein